MFPPSLITLLLMLSSLAGSPESPCRGEVAWSRLSTLLEQRPDTPLQGRFEQERESPLLAEPIRSTGRFALADGLVRFDTETPYPSVMLIEAESVTIYYPEENAAERYPLGTDHGPLGALMRGDLAALQTQYQLALTEQDGVFEAKLHRSASDNAPNEQVIFSINQETGALLEAVFSPDDAPQTRLRFLDVSAHAELTANDIRLEMPEGVKLSDLTEATP